MINSIMINDELYKVGTIYPEWEICKYAMNLHYDSFDTEGIESSDIPERIEKFDNYILKYVSLSDINKPFFDIDDDKVEEYEEFEISTMPPIVAYHLNVLDNKLEIIDGCHRYTLCKEKGLDKILAFVPYTI